MKYKFSQSEIGQIMIEYCMREHNVKTVGMNCQFFYDPYKSSTTGLTCELEPSDLGLRPYGEDDAAQKAS